MKEVKLKSIPKVGDILTHLQQTTFLATLYTLPQSFTRSRLACFFKTTLKDNLIPNTIWATGLGKILCKKALLSHCKVRERVESLAMQMQGYPITLQWYPIPNSIWPTGPGKICGKTRKRCKRGAIVGISALQPSGQHTLYSSAFELYSTDTLPLLYVHGILAHYIHRLAHSIICKQHFNISSGCVV